MKSFPNLSTCYHSINVRAARIGAIRNVGRFAFRICVQPRDEKLWKRALEIHSKAIVIDTHNDITTPMTNDDYDLGGQPPIPYHTSIERMKQGGLTAEFFSLYVGRGTSTHGGAARRTLDMIDSVYRAVERHPNDLMLATSAADIRRAKKQKKDCGADGHRRRPRD